MPAEVGWAALASDTCVSVAACGDGLGGEDAAGPAATLSGYLVLWDWSRYRIELWRILLTLRPLP